MNRHVCLATPSRRKPDVPYFYRVGDGNAWSDFRTFTTAPERIDAFSFVYFGDTQTKPRKFRNLLNAAEARHPETAFYMISGDLVDQGYVRNMWDEFFKNTEQVFSRKPVAPAMGNHDYGSRGRGVRLFNSFFTLPVTVMKDINQAANYSFGYGGARFIVVNRFNVAEETEWLEGELRLADEGGYDFKIVMFHYPVYHPRKGRDNPDAKERWVPLFDKYEVDLVLTGHDHSYARTAPLRGGKPAAPGEFGTTYVVANACEKAYKFEPVPFAEKQFTDIPTYQLVEIDRPADGPATLRYTSRDAKGTVLDEFALKKKKNGRR